MRRLLGGDGYPAGVTGGKRFVWDVFRLSFLRALYAGWVKAYLRAQSGVAVHHDPRHTLAVAVRLVRWHILLDWRRCLERLEMVQRDGSVALGKSPARLKREFQSAWVAAGWARGEGAGMEVLFSLTHPVHVDVMSTG